MYAGSLFVVIVVALIILSKGAGRWRWLRDACAAPVLALGVRGGRLPSKFYCNSGHKLQRLGPTAPSSSGAAALELPAASEKAQACAICFLLGHTRFRKINGAHLLVSSSLPHNFISFDAMLVAS